MIKTTLYLPDLLNRLPIWVLWRLEERDGRMTKVPYQINGRRASATNPATWSTKKDAEAVWHNARDRYHGIGTVMTRRYRTVFIDIDHCIDPTGRFDNRAEDIMSAFMDDNGNLTTYVEVSQSGTGLHLIVIGEIPRSFKNSRLNVEMYDNGRFIAMTGSAISAREPSECAAGLQYVFERYKTPSKTLDWTSRPVDPIARREDDWIIQHAAARDRSKFSALFEGDWSGYSSQSEADLALCKILAFWTNNDPEAIDRLFRRSGLYRIKWERNDYSARTIKVAISTNDDTLSEFTRRRIRERGQASIGELSRVRH